MVASSTETVAVVSEGTQAKIAVVPAKHVDESVALKNGNDTPEVLTGHHEPLKPSGVLDQFEQFDVTPVIGREFANVNLAEWLRAPNSDELLRDLAITGNTLAES